MSDTRRPTGAPLTIGPYTILGELGRGGMGTVYRARDNRLRRDVALKVLPEELRLSPTRLARFEQEARLVAALNHPNIAAIYGIQDGEAGVQALVLELVEGKTLAARIAEGRLGIAEALTIARQIAQALEAAHEKGIVHRDLKPANIVITPTGLVKVLDFGIAKMTDPSEIATSETVTAPFTREDVLVGTPAYMSPEQSRGRAVDKRADLWAFGCVLYEMLTGQRPFEGETSSQTLAAVQTTDPDWGRLPPQVPAVVTTVMKRCLERESAKRLADVAAIRFALEDTPSLAGHTRVADDPRRTFLSARTVVLCGAAAITILAAGVGIGRWLSAEPAETPAIQRLTDIEGMEETPALSPDRTRFAYVAADGDGHRQIWVRPRGRGDTVQTTHDPTDHLYPRWIKGGGLLYYVPPPKEGATGTLWEVPDFGGTSNPITTAMGPSDISHDGKRVVAFQPGPAQHPVIRIINRADGTVEREIDVGKFETYEWLRWSPDDRLIAFTTATSVAFQRTLHVVPAAGGKVSDVVQATRIQGLAWLPDNQTLVYASSDGSTLAYPPLFNLRSVSIDGSGDKVLTFEDVSNVEPDIVGNQVVVSHVRMQSNVWRFPILDLPRDVMAGRIQITHQTGQVQAPSVSPDNTQVVYISDNGGHSNLWISNTDGSNTHQLTFEDDPATVIGVPNWSPAGDRIVYVRSRGEVNSRINSQWVIRANGKEKPRELVPRGVAATWNRDGSWLYFFDRDCIQKIPADGGTAVKVHCGRIGGPAISTDESTLYWGRDDNRSGEIMRASPANGQESVFARFSIARVPWWPITHNISPDDRWLATPLKDGATTNIWRLSTANGEWHQLTDFGHRAILITRIVSWARDSKSVLAAVAETDADIVLFEGLIR